VEDELLPFGAESSSTELGPGKQQRSGGSGGATTENSKDGKTSGSHFTICGQKVASTVRGKAVQEASDDVLALYMKANEDDRYVAAHDERLRLERAVKLEQYQEKKLLERIQNLEVLRGAEVEHQRQIRKRESDRVARKEDLKKDLEAAWTVKLAKEKEQQEIEKRRKEKEAAEHKKYKQYCEKQKEVVTDWYRTRKPKDEEGLATQEEVAREKELQKAREKKNKPKTVKAQLADERIQALHEHMEQRPPLGLLPRPHDIGSTSVDVTDDSVGYPGGGKKASSGRPTPVSWAKEAKKVSDAYGLTPRDYSAVENRLTRTVGKGGRMAQYEQI
jgi:hypothetical protein